MHTATRGRKLCARSFHLASVALPRRTHPREENVDNGICRLGLGGLNQYKVGSGYGRKLAEEVQVP